MTLSKRTLALVILLTLAGGVAIGKLGLKAPVRTEIKTVEKVVYQDRVVEKTVEAKTGTKDDTKNKVVTIVKTVTKAGDVRVETKIVYQDRIIEKQADSVTQTKTEVKNIDRVSTVDRIVTPALSRWTVGAGIGVQPLRLSAVVEFDVSYRFAGPFSLTAWSMVPATAPVETAIGVGLRVAF